MRANVIVFSKVFDEGVLSIHNPFSMDYPVVFCNCAAI